MRRKRSAVRAWSVRVLRFAVIAALVAVMVPIGAPPAHADVDPVTYWVDAAAGNDVTNPGSEAAPWKTISKALSVASGIDTIMVRPGTYSEANGETPYNSSVLLLSDGETIRSTGGADSTIIQGDGTKQLLAVNGWVSGDELYGFTFDNGGTSTGAAVQVNLNDGAASPGEPMIRSCVFSNNDGGSGGGALLISGSTTGSAIWVEFCTFDTNTATYGGAIKADSFGRVEIWQNDFIDNTAQSGGALYLRSRSNLFGVDTNYFEGNTATSGPASGGAIYWYGHGLSYQHRMAYNYFAANTASTAGGGLYLAYAQVGLDSNLVEDCTSPFGGFAYLESATAVAENNSITGCSASIYGAVWNLDSNSSLDERYDTLWGQASGPQAMHLSSGGAGTADITGCIYWNPLLDGEMECANVSYTCSYDDESTLEASLNVVGTGMVYEDPSFDGTYGAPYLDDDSPCIDAGDPADYPPYDYFEDPRPQDGDGVGGAQPDIGCYEVAGVLVPVVLAPVYRFYNFTNNTHFFTNSAEEADHVIATWPKVYRYEGIAYYTNPANNTQPLYRFYNKVSASHFYTASAEEAAHILATWPNIFTLDGQTYAVNPAPVPNSTPVYRFYNLKNGSHFYTASAEEADMVIATWPTIYRFEGPAFWIGQ